MNLFAKMDPELKKEWVAALRSGTYPQTKHALAKGGGYCCLGVLCVVAGRTVYEVSDDVNDYKKPEKYHLDYDEAVDFNYHFAMAALNREDVYATDELIKLNDVLGFNFRQIAAWVEENL